nr:hypothetical protein [Pseudomonadota bacterium]
GQARRIGAVKAELVEVRTMIDRLALSVLIHLPEVPDEIKEGALASGNLRHSRWRRAVEKLLLEEGGVAPLRIKKG